MKKAVAYGRYSTDMQREESIDAQFRAIKNYCEQNNIELIKTYADEGISGTTDHRPQFQQMIADSELGIFDYVIVHKLDRFSRSKYDSAIYKRKLKQNKVTLLSVLENLNGSPESIILESVLEGMSEYFSKNLSREVKKGMKENALNCKFNGGTPPLGFDIDDDKNYVINTYEAEAIKIIFDMYTTNHSYGEIMNELNSLGYKTKASNKFTKNSFYEILNNEKYIGNYIYSQEDYNGFSRRRNYHKKKDRKDMIVIENGIPAIIDKDTWNKAQYRIENAKKIPRNPEGGKFYILTGLIYCGECGSPMSGIQRKNKKGKIYHYYKCNRNHRTRECNAKSVRADKIETQILDCFNDVIFSKFNKEKIIKSMIAFDKMNREDGNIAELEKELLKVNNQIDNLINALMDGIKATSVSDKIKDLENKKGNLALMIAREQKNNLDEKTLEKDMKMFLDLHGDIKKYSPREQNLILRMFIDRIEYIQGKVTLKLKMIDDEFNSGRGFPAPL